MTGPGGFETKVSTFLSILSSAASLLANPVLGIAGAGKIISLIGYAASMVQNASEGARKLKEVDDQIKILVAENRAPTAEEWAAWEARLAAVDARIDKAAEGL
jgi:hypothetical protein